LSRGETNEVSNKGVKRMNMKQAVVGILATECLIGAVILLPNVSQAQDAKVKTAMEVLKSMAHKIGPPQL
jgi:hypothetical protein